MNDIYIENNNLIGVLTKMKKKLLLCAASAVLMFTISGCSSSEEIATMKGGSITVNDYFNDVKSQSTTQQTVQSLIIYKVFDEKYGKDVSDKDIQKKYDESKKTYDDAGQDFKEALEQAGLTEKTYKEKLKSQLSYEAGLKAHLDITDADLKTAWESFHPEVEAQIIQVSTEEEAKEIKKQLTDGKDFAELAKDKSTDTATKEDGGKIKFDSTSTTIPDQVKTDAFKLKDGAVSDPIETTNSSTYQTSYYIVKMIKNKEKGNDMEPYKKEVEEIAENNQLTSSEFATKVISEELKEANVKIKDSAFSDVLAGYLETTSSTDSSAKDSSSSEKNSSSSEETKKSSSSDEKETTSSSSKTEDSSK